MGAVGCDGVGAYSCRMIEWSSDRLVEALLVAPAGAALLARLEAEQRSEELPFPWRWQSADSVDPNAVDAAVLSVSQKPVGELLADAVEAAETLAGPWSSRAPERLAAALRHAPVRASIAAAVVERLGDRLQQALDPTVQEWWWSNRPFHPANPLFGRLGEARRPCTAWMTATWDGLWTATSPEDELADPLIDVWELAHGPISRWQLRVDPPARVYEVNQPTDWEKLVTGYPLARSPRPNTSWELPGPNQHQHEAEALATVEGQQAMRTHMNRFVEPDWNAVAEDWDAVHLTWAGFLTTEGLVVELADDDITMLRNWNSERTLWINPVLSDPEPLPAPALSGAINGALGINVATDRTRRRQDLKWLAHRLGNHIEPLIAGD